MSFNLYKIYFSIFVFIFIFLSISTSEVYADTTLSNITEYTVPTAHSSPWSIVAGQDNSIWFTELLGNKIGQVTSQGIILEYSIPSENSRPISIAADRNGNLWFSESNTNKIGRVNSAGIITEFELPTNNHPNQIAVDLNNNVWFTYFDKDALGKITIDGEVTEYLAPSSISDIAIGFDGNIWYTYQSTNGGYIGRMTSNGSLTEYQIPSGSAPQSITLGPDGNLWFSGLGGRNGILGNITPEGNITEFPMLINDRTPYEIIPGPDANLWFTECVGDCYMAMGRITTNGQISEYQIPDHENNSIQDITTGRDGNIWYTNPRANKIGKFDPKGQTNLSLKDFKQNYNADGSLVPWGLDKLFKVSGCPTMAAEGCAITSFADVLASYGLAKLPDGNIVDPGNLNTFFSKNITTYYNGCGIYFDSAGAVVNYNVLHNSFPKTTSLSDRVKYIDQALNSGNLAIIGTGGHFVVLYKKSSSPAPDGSPDYYIADPYRYLPYATGDRSGKLLSQTYGSINHLADHLQVVIIENKAPKPGKTWVIAGHSPIEFLITDPDGEQTGFNESNDEYLQDIPDSTYGLQEGLVDDSGQLPPSPNILYYAQKNPSDGEYKIEVIGTGSGTYTVDFAETKGAGDNSLQTVAGVAAPGKVDTYFVTNSSGSSTAPAINKEVTYDVLKSDLKTLYDQKLITNYATYTSLDVQVNLMITYSKLNVAASLKKTLISSSLQTFLVQLKSYRGIFVKESAYQILSNDANSLLKNL